MAHIAKDVCAFFQCACREKTSMPDEISTRSIPKVLVLASPYWGGSGAGNRYTAYDVHKSLLRIKDLSVSLDDPYGDTLKMPQLSSTLPKKAKGEDVLDEDMKSDIYEKYPEIAEAYERQRLLQPMRKERLEFEFKRLQNLIAKENPTVICCFPPTPIARVKKALAANNKSNVPIVAVVSDFQRGIFARWTQGATAVVVPTEESRLVCIGSHRIPPEKVYNHGFVVNEERMQSLSKMDKNKLQDQLTKCTDNLGNAILPRNLPKNEPIILLASGSKGVGKLAEVWKTLNNLHQYSESKFHLVTVTGNNPELYDSLRSMNTALPSEVQEKNTILGRCENKNLLELTHISGLPIDKIGSRRCMEAIALKKTLVTVGNFSESQSSPQWISRGNMSKHSADPLPGIERGNEEFMLEHGFARQAATPEALSTLVKKFLDNPSEFTLNGSVDMSGASKTTFLLETLAYGKQPTPAPAPQIAPAATKQRRRSFDDGASAHKISRVPSQPNLGR